MDLLYASYTSGKVERETQKHRHILEDEFQEVFKLLFLHFLRFFFLIGWLTSEGYKAHVQHFEVAKTTI